MASVGSKLVKVFKKVGVPFEKVVDGGNQSGEYLVYEPNRGTGSFLREFFVDASLPYNTPIRAGDIVIVSPDSFPYLVTNKVSEAFRGEVVETPVTLYKCNVSGELWRSSGEVRDAQYHTVPNWVRTKSNAYGLLSEYRSNNTLIEDSPIGQIAEGEQILMLPDSYQPKPLDRYVVFSGENSAEYYKIGVVRKRILGGLVVCQITEDTKEFP